MLSRYQWVVVSVVAIWLAVLLTSLFAPDFVSGSQQEHLKIAALINWLWGTLATVSVLRMFRTAKDAPLGTWMTMGLGVSAIWAVATVVSIVVPRIETGSDPTRIPLAAVIAPIVAMVFTRYVAEFLGDRPVEPEPDDF
jgi:hypothetical protein